MEKEKFIEREIIIGMITSNDFIKHIARVYEPDCLESNAARTIANWCMEYYKKYGQAPGRNMEGIYSEKLKKLQKDLAEDIEDILEGLSNEYEEYESINVDYLMDRTVQHFQESQAKALIGRQQAALDNGDFDAFYSEHTKFKPASVSDLFEDESINAGELYDMELKGPQWLIKDLIPTGLTILGGRSKVGKSYFLMNMAMSLAQARRMFGEKGFKGQSGQILYLSLEDGKRRFQQRMQEIDPNPNKERLGKNLRPRFQWDKLTRGGLDKIEEKLESMKRPRLVIIDTLAKVWSKKASTGGGGLYAEEYAIYSPLADLAHKYEISIILVTHTTKNKSADVFDEILGGMGTQGPADNLIVLANEEQHTDRKRFSIRGKDVEEMHLSFAVDGPAHWEFIGEAEEVQKSMERQALYDLLANEGPMTFSEIKQEAKDKQIGISPNSINTILRKMLRDGTLEQLSKRGAYAVKGAQNSKVAERLGRKKPEKSI